MMQQIRGFGIAVLLIALGFYAGMSTVRTGGARILASFETDRGDLVLFPLDTRECELRRKELAEGRKVFVNAPWGQSIFAIRISCDGSDPRLDAADGGMCPLREEEERA